MKTCKHCKREFDLADRASPTAAPGAIAQIRYCSQACLRAAGNKRYYKKHRRAIIRRVKANKSD
jgi:hypothetical protein